MKTVLKNLFPFKRYFILFKISKKVLCYNPIFLCYDLLPYINHPNDYRSIRVQRRIIENKIPRSFFVSKFISIPEKKK